MNEQQLKEKLLDQLLYFAVDEVMEGMAAELPSEDALEKRAFSPAFEKRMARFFSKIKKAEKSTRTKRTLFKTAAAALVFLAVSSAVVFSVDAFRTPFLNLFIESGEKASNVRIVETRDKYEAVSDQIHGMYLPAYIPATYEVKTIDKPGSIQRVVFENAGGDRIILTKYQEGSNIGVDNEEVEKDYFAINGQMAYYYAKNGQSVLLFLYDNNVFMLNTDGLAKDEIIKMAKSMYYVP